MKIKINKVKENLIELLKKFWQNLFLILILLLVLDLILGGIFFWKYYLRPQEKELQIIPPLKISQGLMEKVSGEWARRESIFKEAEEKEYPDPFRGALPEKID
ncbi:hypothetical protein KJA17_00770 [Patescibacteria group bacterium]|nr:hypothetical protein [Patescibacteria group bacterium]